MNGYSTWIVLICSTLFFAGCGHVLSIEARSRADGGLGAMAVQKEPDRHRGKVALLGGLIMAVVLDEKGTTLEVHEYRLDRWGEPVGIAEGGTRFLARSPSDLDPTKFFPGRFVTLAGRAEEVVFAPQGPSLQNYRYPVFAIEEIHLWDTPFVYGQKHPHIDAPVYIEPPGSLRSSPYDPGYYAYPYTPYWYRP